MFSMVNSIQHYCGEKPRTVDEYIMRFDEPIRQQLILVRDALREALPDAVEKISWSMPTYWDQHNIIHFAGNKKHIGLYPGEEAVTRFSKELDARGFQYSKGSIQIPYRDQLPLELIKEIATWCGRAGEQA
jgi:uncharacterized protein YdhG (YjbR/CyaY superfamily)